MSSEIVDPGDSGTPSPDNSLPPAEHDMLRKLINSNAKKLRPSRPRTVSSVQDDANKIHAHLTEYFDDFILIGHTVTGERVVIQYAPTSQKADAIKQAMGDVLHRLVG